MPARLLILFGAILVATVCHAQNPIQIENAKSGTTDWELTNPALDNEIAGYASLTSVNRGGQISFYVRSTDPTYTIDIFRMGYYGLSGGRRVMSTITLSSAAQPTCPQDATTGMTECQWTNPYVLTVPHDPNDPTNWASGVYLAKLTGQPSGKQSYIVFVVRDDVRPSQFLFVQNVTTYQAYNYWGGKSLYGYNSTDGVAAVIVSFNRPYAAGPQAGAGYGVGAGEFLTAYTPSYETYPAAWEYNAVRWLEQQGYDLTYATSVDLHEQANLLLNHAAYLSFGHNEYWSMAMRTNVTNARDNGVNLGFFGANTLYWQVRFESSPLSGQADRTEVCYKGAIDPVTGPTHTVQWRHLDPPQPEAALIGVMYRHDPVQGDIVVQNTSNWVFRGTDLTNGTHLQGLLGYEVDSTDSFSPVGTIVLGNSPYLSGTTTQYSNMSVYTAASGATVFATGSIQWSWGLDDYNSTALRPAFSNPAAQQITKNVLSRFTTIGVKVAPSNVNVPAGDSQAFTAIVTGTSSHGVTWSMSPSVGTLSRDGLYTAPATVSTPQTVTITATSVADGLTQGSATINLGLPPALQTNSGGPAYTDTGKIIWSADTGFSGGKTASTTGTISNTSDSTLYQTERYGVFNYNFSVPAGSYSVTLKFAEFYFRAAGQRIFNVAINGTTVLSNFDIFAQAGGAFIALDKTFTVNATTGTISIQFIEGSADRPKVDAIQISSGSPPTITAQPASQMVTVGQTARFTVLATGSPLPSYQWRKDGQSITGATSSSYTTPATVVGDDGSTFDVVVSNAAGSMTSIAATLKVNMPPTVVLVTPSNGTGQGPQTFDFVYSDPNGYTDLKYLSAQFSPTGAFAHSCYLTYARNANSLYLVNDAGTGYLKPATLGSAGTLQNSQCTVDPARSSVSGSGTDLFVKLAISFTPAFQGKKIIMMYAADNLGLTDGWQSVGTWTVPYQIPSVASVTSSSGSGTSHTFSRGVIQGSATINLDLLPTVHMGSEGPGATDAGGTTLSVDAGISGGDLGSTMATISNTSDQRGFRVSTTLTVNVPPTITTQPTKQIVTIGQTATYTVVATGSPAPSFQWRKGKVNIAGAAASSYTTPATVAGDDGSTFDVVVSNKAGSVNSSPASLTVNAPPAVVSMTANNGHGFLFQTFRFVYSDPNGYGDLSDIRIRLTPSEADANPCYIKYLPKANGLYLYDDTGTSFVGPVTLGSAVILQNSQCSVDVGSSSMSAWGNDLRVNLSMRFTIPRSAKQVVSTYAADSAGLTTGWITVGSWTLMSSLPRRRAR